jgi:hypothetical protein
MSETLTKYQKYQEYYINYRNTHREDNKERCKEYYAKKRGDRVKCDICNVELYQWRLRDHCFTKRHLRKINAI